ncbi:MAG: protein-glutamate O-methyltransferase [Alphaproteobacteria bacterium]
MTKLAPPKTREFSLTDAEYRSIRDRIYDLAGIKLGDQKQDLVYSRLTKRLRAIGVADFASYLRLLDGPDGHQELELMLNALTTNLTSFFRESHHFDHLKTIALQESLERQQDHGRQLRIWSSACSTGEEPYSIAMTLLESNADLSRVDARILATDINTDVLSRASQGRYGAPILAKCPASCRTHFRTFPDGSGEVKAEVKNLITFRKLNLLGSWPMSRQFDVIFCRNVLIYFDNKTKAQLVDRFVEVLRPNGWLYLGHSESASGSHPALEPAGRTIYRKIS